MSSPWNDSSVLPPPVNMFLCRKKVDISSLKHVFKNIVKVLSKQSPLHKESALCSRFVYKYDRKFCNDIGYRNLKKAHTALKKYLTLNLLKDIEGFICALPSETDDEMYLPTRQMLEYVMLRIITFSMTMLRVCTCSKQSAIFYLNRLKRGESHWMSLLPYALLSRLWSMCMVLIQQSTNWYSNLYPYLNILEYKGLPFLPEHYELPQDLKQWLDLDNIDNFGKFNWDEKKATNLDYDLLGDENENSDILNFVNKLNRDNSDQEIDDEFKPLLNNYKNQLLNSVSNIDITKDDATKDNYKINQDRGEILSRASFQNANIQSRIKVAMEHKKDNKLWPLHISEANAIVVKENQHSHMKVTSVDSLKDFFKMEEEYRSKGDSRCLSAHLSLMQWHALKNALVKLCDIVTNRKIEKKFQKIWKEKCLDCNL